MKIRIVFALAVQSLLAASVVACSSSQDAGTAGTAGAADSCFPVGFQFCPKDKPATQTDVDACHACSAKYQALISCDPHAGFVCTDGIMDTRKDGVCGQQINDFESCFVHAQQSPDASPR
jgi:hypothetical protein